MINDEHDLLLLLALITMPEDGSRRRSHERRSILRLVLVWWSCSTAEAGGPVQVRSVVIASPDGPTCAEASAAAAVLRHDGVVVLKCEALEAHAPPSDNAEAILQGLMTRMNGLGMDVDQRFSFAEICHRSPRRYDVHLGAGGAVRRRDDDAAHLHWPSSLGGAAGPPHENEPEDGPPLMRAASGSILRHCYKGK